MVGAVSLMAQLVGEAILDAQQKSKKMIKDDPIDDPKDELTAAGIPTWSPTVVLISRSTAYVWQSGRDAQFSAACGRK